MKMRLSTLKGQAVQAFTLLEIQDSKIVYIFHLMETSSAVTCTLFIRPLTIIF